MFLKQHKISRISFVKRILFSAIICLQFSTNAQKQANNWYFGDSAGVNFNTTPPQALTNSAMFSFEGCASVSDSNGILLFYSDGNSVWNSNHQIMPNGNFLYGYNFSTQSSLIVPLPGSTTIFYLFTTDYTAGIGGFRYSVVDLNLNGGLGDIALTSKNRPLLHPATEKIAATHHANGRDIWIITHGWENARYYAYLLTPNGINPNPVVTNIGAVHQNGGWAGQLKTSTDGKKLVACMTDLNLAELFDFDNQTGIISNSVSFTNWTRPYGCEFSPDASKLYITCTGIFPDRDLFQVDISSGIEAQIKASITTITTSPYSLGCLQLGPDNKIYVAENLKTYLSVINNPNALGAAANYVSNGIFLEGKASSLGLPAILSSNPTYMILFEPIGDCFADSNCFEFMGSNGFDSLVWYFGDNSETKNTQHKIVCQTYSIPDTYDIKLTFWKDGKSFSASQTVTIKTPNVTRNVYNECDGFSVNVESNTYRSSGVYKDVLDNCDTIITDLTIYPLPRFNLITTPDSCDQLIGGIEMQDLIGNGPFTFEWSNKSSSPSLRNIGSGEYTVTVTDSLGCSKSVSINVGEMEADCEFYFFIPNAFSPNGDGLNDVFRPEIFYLKNFNMEIYNRWGEKLYQTNNPNDSWDGTFGNNICPKGIYTVIITYETKAKPGETFHHRSTLHLIK